MSGSEPETDSGNRSARPAASAPPHAAGRAEPRTYTVYATREGLVGGTTANGHVIQPGDHFVALPSHRALSPQGTSRYSVRVRNPRTGRSETVPVWDIGPWNTRDDYWNGARETWHDLPQGTPEAQAAYHSGYNGGRDELGRKVLNPAGIDLADGTFAAIGMTDNGLVEVTFLWTEDGAGGYSVCAYQRANVRSHPTTSAEIVSFVVADECYPANCWTRGETISDNGVTNDVWVQLALNAGGVGYVSAVYLKGDERGGLPQNARC